jgi:hypothetical protein
VLSRASPFTTNEGRFERRCGTTKQGADLRAAPAPLLFGREQAGEQSINRLRQFAMPNPGQP